MKIQPTNYSYYSMSHVSQNNNSNLSKQNVQFKGVIAKTMTCTGSLLGFGLSTTAINLIRDTSGILAVLGVSAIICGSVIGNKYGIKLEEFLKKQLQNAN